MERTARLKAIEIVSALIEPYRYECIDIEWDSAEETLRIFIDSESGISMEDCLRVNALLIENTDLDSLIHGDFRLEVSSPGLERPLRTKEHFAKHIGQKVHLKLGVEIDGKIKGSGNLLSISSDETLTLESARGLWVVPLNAVNKARLQYDW